MIHMGSVFLGFRMLFRSHASRKTTRHLVGAVLGIGFSIVPLITVIEVSGGMIEGITRRFIEIGSYHLQIKSYSPQSREEVEAVLETVSSFPRVERSFPVVFGEGLVYSPDSKTGVSVRSLPEDYYRNDGELRRYLTIESGSFTLQDRDDALLSREVADKLQVKAGDRVRLLTARSVPGRAPILRPTVFTVRGIFSTGYYELDSLSMYIPLRTGEVLFEDAGNLVLGVKVDGPYDGIESLARDLTSVLPQGWFVYTWYNLERPMLESFNTTRNLLIFIMVLIVAVAAVNISSSMIMLVIEKEPEIAMLKSMGVSPARISSAFMYTGFFIGITAVLFGITIGLLAAVNINEMLSGIEAVAGWTSRAIKVLFAPGSADASVAMEIFDRSYYLETIPIRINFIDVFGTAAGTLFLATGAAFFPARRAGRIKPLEILRKH
ncbi:MAG: ABC transporter permease [Spirochaetota bacterium]|nr:ABC transporter permease [Spirochaetota bacterium]